MEMIDVEVCYALSDKQILQQISLPIGSTVIRAIMASQILDQFPELELNNNVGIFSQKVKLDRVLKSGDRVEIYRPLILTPNELRLQRAKRK